MHDLHRIERLQKHLLVQKASSDTQTDHNMYEKLFFIHHSCKFECNDKCCKYQF